MCGVAGYVGLGHLPAEQRFDLVEALGIGIDSRGGDAAGFCVINGPSHRPIVRLARKLDEWQDARGRFIRAASSGHSVMMHARWTTSGNAKDIECAHPFPIRRKRGATEKVVLYGAHNGMLEGTVSSARMFQREHTVDSREFLELLADKRYDVIQKLEGYGVVTYVRPEDGIIRVVRISSNSDFEIVALEGGGIVYASTASILKDALEFAGLDGSLKPLSVSAVGRVYRIEPQKVRFTGLSNVRVSSTWWKGWGNLDDDAYYDPAYGRVVSNGACGVSTLEPDNWSFTYKKVWSEKLKRYQWLKYSLVTGECLEETGFLDPQLPLTVESEPESDSKLPSEPPPSSAESADAWAKAAEACAPESVDNVLTPPDFDAEQAEAWEQFWRENRHMLKNEGES